MTMVTKLEVIAIVEGVAWVNAWTDGNRDSDDMAFCVPLDDGIWEALYSVYMFPTVKELMKGE
jgi:hypothetical protein